MIDKLYKLIAQDGRVKAMIANICIKHKIWDREGLELIFEARIKDNIKYNLEIFVDEMKDLAVTNFRDTEGNDIDTKVLLNELVIQQREDAKEADRFFNETCYNKEEVKNTDGVGYIEQIEIGRL